MCETSPAKKPGECDLSIVIVSWRVRGLLRQCLASLECEGVGLEKEVVVVDNCSDDGTAEMVREEFPRVNLIVNEENAGFSRACNQGYRQTAGRYLLFLNPDAVVLPESLGAMIRFAETHPACGVIGPAVFQGDGMTFDESCVRRLPRLSEELLRLTGIGALARRMPLCSRFCAPARRMEEATVAESVSGCCMLVRREAFEDVGLFDERFHLYAEDHDLCARMRKNLWQVWHLPEAKVVHHGDRSGLQNPYGTRREHLHSHFLYYRKHSGLLAAVLYRLGVGIISAFLLTLNLGRRMAFRWHRTALEWALKGRRAPDACAVRPGREA